MSRPARPTSAAYRDACFPARLADWLEGGDASTAQKEALTGLLTVAKLDTARREIEYEVPAAKARRARPNSAPARRVEPSARGATGVAAVADKIDVGGFERSSRALQRSSARASARPQSARRAKDSDNDDVKDGTAGQLSAIYQTTSQIAFGGNDMGVELERAAPAKSQYHSAWGDGLKRSADATRYKEDGTLREPERSEYQRRFGHAFSSEAGDNEFYEQVQSRRLYYGDLLNDSNCERLEQHLNSGLSLNEKKGVVEVMRGVHAAVAHDMARKQSTMRRDFEHVRPTEVEAKATREFVANNLAKNTRQHMNLFHTGETAEQRERKLKEAAARKASAAAARRLRLKKAKVKQHEEFMAAFAANQPRRGVAPVGRAKQNVSQVPLKSFTQPAKNSLPPSSVYSQTLSNMTHAADLRRACAATDFSKPSVFDTAPFGKNDKHVVKVERATYKVPYNLVHRPGKPERRANTTYRRGFERKQNGGDANDNRNAVDTNRDKCGASTAPLGKAALATVLPEEQFTSENTAMFKEPATWGRDTTTATRMRDLARWPTSAAGALSKAGARELEVRAEANRREAGGGDELSQTARQLAAAQERYAQLSLDVDDESAAV
jgi:hypothetical protein